MADKKITALTAVTTLTDDDLFVVVDDPSGTATTKKITAANVKSGLAPLASPTFTGTPAAPTAAADTNTTQIATTAYVVGQGYLKSSTASTTYIANSLVDAKGDLIVATANDTPARLAVGVTNGHVLMVDSATSSGLKWDAVPASPPDSDQAVIAASVFA